MQSLRNFPHQMHTPPSATTFLSAAELRNEGTPCAYLALYDLSSQPPGMTVAQVSSRDSNHLPEQTQLELDQSRRCETIGI